MLNEDLATNTSMIDGDGVIQWSFSPLFIDGNIRVKQSLFGIFGGADVTAHLFLDPSTLSLDVAAPMHVNYINVNANVNAGIKMNTDLKCYVNAGFSAELAGIKKDVGVCTATAILTVNAAMSGEFKYGIPFNISGTGGLSAHVSCGVFDGGVGVTGAYSLPSPFCLAAGMSFSIPYPSMCCHCKWCFCPAPCIDYYNLGFGLRWKSNANPMFSFSPTCD